MGFMASDLQQFVIHYLVKIWLFVQARLRQKYQHLSFAVIWLSLYYMNLIINGIKSFYILMNMRMQSVAYNDKLLFIGQKYHKLLQIFNFLLMRLKVTQEQLLII